MVKDHEFYVSIGRKGRLVCSEKQKLAAQRNGKLGGWPKGRKRGTKTVGNLNSEVKNPDNTQVSCARVFESKSTL